MGSRQGKNTATHREQVIGMLRGWETDVLIESLRQCLVERELMCVVGASTQMWARLGFSTGMLLEVLEDRYPQAAAATRARHDLETAVGASFHWADALIAEVEAGQF